MHVRMSAGASIVCMHMYMYVWEVVYDYVYKDSAVSGSYNLYLHTFVQPAYRYMLCQGYMSLSLSLSLSLTCSFSDTYMYVHL